jgi:hypothetical protein
MDDPRILGMVLLGGAMFAEGFLVCLALLFVHDERGHWGS